MSCIELCGGVHTAQRQTSIQIPIDFNVSLSVFVCVSICYCLDVGQCEHTINPKLHQL